MKSIAVQPAGGTLTAAASTLVSKLKAFGSGFMCMLREIGDENAYDRWLKEHSRPHSPENWRQYCDERFNNKFRKPKCC